MGILDKIKERGYNNISKYMSKEDIKAGVKGIVIGMLLYLIYPPSIFIISMAGWLIGAILISRYIHNEMKVKK